MEFFLFSAFCSKNFIILGIFMNILLSWDNLERMWNLWRFQENSWDLAALPMFPDCWFLNSTVPGIELITLICRMLLSKIPVGKTQRIWTISVFSQLSHFYHLITGVWNYGRSLVNQLLRAKGWRGTRRKRPSIQGTGTLYINSFL